MPFFDFNQGAPPDLDGYDAVIVGAGAAGIFLAVKLSARQQRVLLLESGHLAPDDERQELNAIEQTGKTLSNAIWCRKRIVGGTTTAWGGQALPFGPLDFERRDWVENSGWPVSGEEVARHYPAACAFMKVDPWNFDTDLYGRLNRDHPGFAASLIRYHFSKWAREPDFRKLYRRELERDVTVLYNAHLLRIDLSESGRVGSILVANFARQERAIPIKGRLLLAAGGIESNRILLHNRHQIAAGLGNHSGWLGQAFMEHPCMEAGIIEPRNEKALQRIFNTRWHAGRKYSVRLSAAASWQRTARMLNTSAGVMFRYPSETPDPLDEIKGLYRRFDLRGLASLGRNLSRVAPLIATLATERLVYKPGAIASLAFMTEQEPDRGSFIALGEQKDRFGMRLARLHWQITKKTWDTTVAFAQVIQAEIERLGLGRVRLHSQVAAGTPDWERHLTDVNHHMGGTRMSADPAHGVVNPDLQVWGIPNCFVCSCSVFPTSSHSNPTLTLLALCARLADRL